MSTGAAGSFLEPGTWQGQKGAPCSPGCRLRSASATRHGILDELKQMMAVPICRPPHQYVPWYEKGQRTWTQACDELSGRQTLGHMAEVLGKPYHQHWRNILTCACSFAGSHDLECVGGEDAPDCAWVHAPLTTFANPALEQRQPLQDQEGEADVHIVPWKEFCLGLSVYLHYTKTLREKAIVANAMDKRAQSTGDKFLGPGWPYQFARLSTNGMTSSSGVGC
jgi:hypothetical protein